MNESEKKIMEIAEKEGYQLRGLRMFSGMEETGTGFNASLFRKGKLVATLVNDDSGGETMWNGLSKEEEYHLKGLCALVPPVGSEYFPDLVMKCDINVFVDTMVDQINDQKYWKRRCAKKTCVILKSHKKGQFTQYSQPYTPDLARAIRKAKGEELVEIVNERFLTNEVKK